MGFWDIFDTIKSPTSPAPSTYAGFPADIDDWGCGQWYLYHRANAELYGVEIANKYLINDFERLNPFADAWACKYDCDFLNYLKNNGINYTNFISDIYCTAENLTSATRTTSESVAKLSKIILPLALIGGAYYIYTNGKF